jgi:hypothetical protein
MMATKKRATEKPPALLDVVALLTDLPRRRLARGQVGTIVEKLKDGTLLVEFSDDQGRRYALVTCTPAQLLPLRYVENAA